MKRLYLEFVNQADGKRRRVVLNEPSEDLDATSVEAAMDQLIALHVVSSNYVKDRAAIVETNTNEFFDLIQ
ncbi:MAG: DUF2922 domain-containing protein [Thermotogae bacterium]|nr:MAG: DUF2922 domain-containing protein [Thermotogota bacterium]